MKEHDEEALWWQYGESGELWKTTPSIGMIHALYIYKWRIIEDSTISWNELCINWNIYIYIMVNDEEALWWQNGESGELWKTTPSVGMNYVLVGMIHA
jgi:hypothetical protein